MEKNSNSNNTDDQQLSARSDSSFSSCISERSITGYNEED